MKNTHFLCLFGTVNINKAVLPDKGNIFKSKKCYAVLHLLNCVHFTFISKVCHE